MTPQGGCSCGAVRYRLTSKPMMVHCCHCSDCQRLTGSTYAVNAIIETDRVEVTGDLSEHHVATPSGKGQTVSRCRACGVAVFSAYMIRLGKLLYVRVGTLDNPETCPPMVQIFTSSKQPWVPLSDAIPAFEEFYEFQDVWPADSLERRDALFTQ